MQIEIITTERLKLRLINLDVLNYVFLNYSDKKLISFFGLKTAQDLDIEKLKYHDHAKNANKTFLYFQLIDKKSDKIIGVCGLHNWFPEHPLAEIDYSILSDESKDKGFMTEAIQSILHYGFEQMNLFQIEAYILSNNIASLKLIKKLNFKQIRLVNESICQSTRLEKSLAFSLLNTDFVKMDTDKVNTISKNFILN